jgi:hypothetical protein
MAGIGFSLRSIRGEDSYFDLVRLYGAAGIISSGPWLICILNNVTNKVTSTASTTVSFEVTGLQGGTLLGGQYQRVVSIGPLVETFTIDRALTR